MKKYSAKNLKKLCSEALLKVGVNEDVVFDVSECLIETSWNKIITPLCACCQIW